MKLSISTETFYNQFSFLYPLINIFLKSHKKELFNEVNNQKNGTLLEIGVGDGSHLTQYKKHQVTAIDTSENMLKVAEKYKGENITLRKMSGENLEFKENTFDYVVLSHVISVVAKPEQMLDEVYRVLKPNGMVFILNHFTPNNFLKYLDFSFKYFSKWVHFKSLFYMEDISTIHQFKQINEIKFKPFSYFKLLVFSKK